MPSPPALLRDEDLPPAPRQKRSMEKRAKFLEAGRTAFAEKGYEAASIKAIASRAGAATGAFYVYFRSKRQLLLVLMNELIERLSSVDLRPQGSDGGVRNGLRQHLARVFEADLEYFGVIRAWQEASLADDGLRALEEAIQRWTEGRILAVFQAMQQHPAARRDVDLPMFARMMDRHFWALLARGAKMSGEEFAREVRTVADVICFYLFALSEESSGH